MLMLDRLLEQIRTGIRSLRDEEGQGMAEYGAVLALIAVVCAASFTDLGSKVVSMVNTIAAAL